MNVDLKTLFDGIFSRLNTSYSELAEKVSKGSCATLDEYKLLCGKMHGLQQGVTHTVDALKAAGVLVSDSATAPQAPLPSTEPTPAPIEGEVIAPESAQG